MPAPPRRFTHIAYVVDRSGSMISVFDKVKEELLNSVGLLEARQDFHVAFFSEGRPFEPVETKLVPANADYKAKFVDGLKHIFAKGSTDPLPALTRAFDVLDKAEKPGGKVIFLITDGAFPDNDAVLKLCRQRNSKRDVSIFTLLFGASADADGEKALKAIAEENGGKYKFVKPE